MNTHRKNVYLTKAKFVAYKRELDYMQHEGTEKLSKLLASSPGSGMGRPLDLPVHDLARRFYARIDELRVKLNNAVIIEEYIRTLGDLAAVNIGARVTITNLDENKSEVYAILGPDEIDFGNGRISFLAPLGAALMGKKKDEVAWVQSPEGKYGVRIDKVEYLPFDFSYAPADWDHQLDAVGR